MLKSIQWKLVIISFLLVWLAMSIVGVFITEEYKQFQIDSMENTTLDRTNYLAEILSKKINGNIKDVNNIKETGDNWYIGQGQHIKALKIYEGNDYLIYDNSDFDNKSNVLYIDTMLDKVFETKKYVDVEHPDDEYYRHIMVPIVSSSEEILGAVYVGLDLSEVTSNIDKIRTMLTSATVLALSITALLGIVLARTITGPIKEVTSKAEQLAKGEYGQVIAVKSDDEVGQLTQMFNYLSSRLKNTLEEVFNEKNKVDTIVTHMTDGIIAVSNDGIIIHANPAVFKMLNINDEQLEQRKFNEFSKQYGLGVTVKDLLSDSDYNHNILSINNSIIKMNVVPFKNEKNEINGLIVVLQDVTEQERLDKMRKEFVANVSHELRTPLTTIKSYTETLLDGAMENKEYTINFLKVINSESDRMTRLVKDLLQLSKLDYDNIHWNMKAINLVDIVKDCVSKLDISAMHKKQELSFDFNKEAIEVTGDKDRIEQVIINIISNAIKYTPDNGKIDVAIDEQQEYIVIKVTDTGMGIPKEDLPRLFERFYRVDKARSRMLGGTGLGLSIAKQIVEAHKGYIQIDSEYGQGTEVKIGFPRF